LQFPVPARPKYGAARKEKKFVSLFQNKKALPIGNFTKLPLKP
jgi:hypothetical protein